MKADSFFEQGTTHEVCEDYSTHGEDYAIISDGCSKQGNLKIDTDWGSRIICKAAELCLPALFVDLEEFVTATMDSSLRAVTALPNLKRESLTATLLAAYHVQEMTRVVVIGDGVWGAKRRDGTWDIHTLEFLPGGSTEMSAPYYLKYKMFGEDARYLEQFGGRFKHTRHVGDLMGGDMTEVVETKQLDIDRPFVWMDFDTAVNDFVFVGSDGLSSFYRTVQTETSRHNEPVLTLDVLRVLFDVNFANPNFLRLQRNWCWKRNARGSFPKLNWHNADDVSLGGVRV